MPISSHEQSQFESDIVRDLATTKTDIQLIKRDIQSLQFLYTKLDNSISKLDSATSKLENIHGIQERTMKAMEDMMGSKNEVITDSIDRIERDIENEFQAVRRESIERNDALIQANKTRDDRISKLEAFRWILVGGILLMSFLMPYLDRHLFPDNPVSTYQQETQHGTPDFKTH